MASMWPSLKSFFRYS